MRELARAGGTFRAIVAMVALYALLLQPFVAAATPRLTAGGEGVLCLDHDGAVPDGPGPAGHHGHPCCLHVTASPLAPPPQAFVSVAFAPEPASSPGWRLVALAPKTGPPTYSHAARGPPAA